ncbi:MAG: lysophospholipid acyltransferase family protein [Caldicoprobacterales bacterium]|nr:1-acyl-sn-glycerol-3-phosphate acyltransferase [Clostridiales bacterium]
MLYFIARVILIPFIYLLFWPKVKGKENLPLEGSAIIYANHTSVLDPILLGCLLPRKIYFMAKQELFKFPPAGTVLKLLGAFPVKRGTADITAIKTALRTLREGNVFGIFPEGTRSKSGNLQNFTHGIAAIAHKSRAVAVPVKISGGYKLFHSIQVTIGKPLDFKQYYGKKSSSELLDRISEEMSEAVKSLA